MADTDLTSKRAPNPSLLLPGSWARRPAAGVCCGWTAGAAAEAQAVEDVEKPSVAFRMQRCEENNLHRCSAIDDRHLGSGRTTHEIAGPSGTSSYSTASFARRQPRRLKPGLEFLSADIERSTIGGQGQDDGPRPRGPCGSGLVQAGHQGLRVDHGPSPITNSQ